MSKRSRNSLLSAQSKFSQSNHDKDDLASMKYLLTKPSGLIYPLDSKPKESEGTKLTTQDLTYPDFQPWRDPTQMNEQESKEEEDKMRSSLYLNKGLFETSQVSNEYYSARNLIQATLFSSGENCFEVLKELSLHLASVYKSRNEVINKIQYDSNNFKLPSRVTLTSLKRELWLKELADPTIPLLKVSARVPHGIKNKVLLDALTSRQVPIIRALWFTKCVLYSDSILIRKKVQARAGQTLYHSADSHLMENPELQWLQEWTQQVVDYLYRFSREFSNVASSEKKQEAMSKLNYLLRYLQTLYIECLLDKNLFLASIARFFREGLNLESHNIVQLLLSSKSDVNDEEQSSSLKHLDLNYGQRLVALLLVKVFWNEILKSDYICKELSEVLLLNYFFIDKAPIFNPKSSRNQNPTFDHSLSPKLKEKLLHQISESIIYLFKLNTNIFIIPTYWILIGETLYSIMLKDSEKMSKEEVEETQKQLQLILIRNESLMINMKAKLARDPGISIATHKRTSSFPASFTPSNIQFETGISLDTRNSDFDSLETEIFINRSADDALRIIEFLDKQKLNEDLAKLLRPGGTKTKRLSSSFDWKLNLSIVLMWCITKYRDPEFSSENILMICGFIKYKVINFASSKALARFKASIENAILDIVYTFLDTDKLVIDFKSLYVLINELYQLKIITISAYLRKLIASGIFYLDPGLQENLDNSTIKVHISILKNLPVLNNKQCDNILKKWSDENIDFNDKFLQGQKVLQERVIDNIKGNSLHSIDLNYLRDLEVGIKFLLVNWMTEEINSVINNWSKLIHVRVLNLAVLYELYAGCENLAVFFKIIIKSILKNEGKVIILDLDTLYLISKLVIRHFKLIKSISGNDSGSVGYEIFKLIISNYKDLETREPDYLNFTLIWKFIDKAVDRRPTDDSNTGVKIEKPTAIPQFIYSKATVESPMKVSSTTGNTKNSTLSLSLDDFKDNLDKLLSKSYQFMSNDEVQEVLAALKVSDLNQIVNGENGTRRLLLVLLDYYMRAGSKLAVSNETQLVRLTINLRNILLSEHAYSFLDCVSYFCQKQLEKLDMNADPEKSMLKNLLKKLVANEIVDLNLIVNLIPSIFSNEDLNFNYNRLIYDLLIGNEDEEKSILGHSQALFLKINREEYRLRQGDKVFETIANELKSQGSDLLLSSAEFEVDEEVAIILRRWLFTRSRCMMQNIADFFTEDQIIHLLNKISNLGTEVLTIEDLVSVAPNIKEFNLPLFQLLLRLILLKELSPLSSADRYSQLKQFVESVIPKLRFQFSLDNSFFGELFNLLPWNFKTDILGIFESILFSNTEFLVNELSVVSIFKEFDILPLLSDFFNKFSIASMESIGISQELFDRLSNYLTSLLTLITSIPSSENTVNSVSINRALSIFIRTLIIHKEPISKFLISNESRLQFLKDLKSLLVSPYLSENNERLRILLYDLLLMLQNIISKEFLKKIKKTSIKEEDKTGDFNLNVQAPQPPTSAQLEGIFDLPEIDSHSTLRNYLDETSIQSAYTLQDSEISKEGDFHVFNQSNLNLSKLLRDSVFTEPFNILGEKSVQTSQIPMFQIKSYEIIENTNSGANNGRLNLLLFEAHLTKQNPP